ncbi:MAG: copper amine oxidase N-terminal protein [Clostridia bacterium]|nr:copper amine oxidase N-terminal protein [Clostridia bacterium]
MNKKMTAILMALIVAAYPMGTIQAETIQQTIELDGDETPKDAFYIEPDTKKITLTLDSKQAIINNKKYNLSTAPAIIKERVYVPFKFVAEQVLDADSLFDAANKKVTLSKYDKEIVFYEGQVTVLINGTSVTLETAPILHNGSLMIPLKFISEQFDMPFSLDKNKVSLTFTDGLDRPVKGERPTAKFSFDKEAYIAGQEVKVRDESYGQEGSSIIERQWQIDYDNTNRTADLEEFLKHPAAGIHYVSLRVKDNRRNWSPWTTEKIEVDPNKAPIISNLEMSKSSYAQGEKLDMTFTYENEEWESIDEEIWSYRYIDEKAPYRESTIGKPTALFYPGKFLIELQLKDAYGNLSEKKGKTVTITNEVEQSELDYKFKEGIVGTVIDNMHNFNYINYDLIQDYTVINTGAKLLMSNSPESVKQKGILYRDVVQGEGRILYHHRNMIEDESEGKRLVIMIENKNDKAITVTKRREGTKGPTHDILYAGALVLKDHLNKDFYEDITIQAGQKKYLFDTGARKWHKGDTVSGMIDFYSNEEVEVTIAMVSGDTQIAEVAGFPILPRDGIHSRGSFENADRYYTLDIDNDKPYRIMLGKPDGDMEPWMQGYDALTGQGVMNKGNYGMLYHLRLKVKEETGILFNARGNIYKGAIGFVDKGSYEMPLGGLLKNVQQAVVGGVVNKDKVNELLYVLPNGSAAPIFFCFIPKSEWNK